MSIVLGVMMEIMIMTSHGLIIVNLHFLMSKSQNLLPQEFHSFCIEKCLKYGKQEPQLSRVATISKIMIVVCDSVRAGSSS